MQDAGLRGQICFPSQQNSGCSVQGSDSRVQTTDRRPGPASNRALQSVRSRACRSGLEPQTPHPRFQTSDHSFQTSGFRLLAQRLGPQTLGPKPLASRLQGLRLSDSSLQTAGLKLQTSGFWGQASDLRFQSFGFTSGVVIVAQTLGLDFQQGGVAVDVGVFWLLLGLAMAISNL